MVAEIQARKFPSKILLLGEYSILGGSLALTLPFHRFSAQWKKELLSSQPLSLWQPFTDYLSVACPFIDTASLTKVLLDGWRIHSNIPQGCGLGSSGAVCAAIYEVFSERSETHSLKQVQIQFAQMEAFFHGTSSGVDPLTSWCDMPLIINKDSVASRSIQLPDGIYLIDSKQERKTAPLVSHFKEQLKDPIHKQLTVNELHPAIANAIQALLDGEKISFNEAWRRISAWQFTYMKPMIPESLLNPWKNGLLNDSYYIKLCGAGGGGFFLCLQNDDESLPEGFETIPVT